MAASPRVCRRDSLRFLLVEALVAWVAVAGLVACTSQESPQGLAETPTVAAQESPSAAPSPTPLPAPVAAPVLPPQGAQFPASIAELASELELGGNPVSVAESVSIPPLCDVPERAGQATWSVARVSAGETPENAGYCLLGSLPGVYVQDDVVATIEGGEVLEDGRVSIGSMEQLTSIIQDGVLVFAADGARFAVPIYVSLPDSERIKDGIDESRMIPVPDFCTEERPLLSWLVLDEGGEAFELDGDDHLDAVYGDTEILMELEGGEVVTIDWETGTYVRVPSQGSTEDLFVGLIAPEPPPMVDVATREEVEAWWQVYGLRDASGRALQVRIEEESYLDDRGYEVKTFKVVGSGEVVWMRVFANVPREPTGRASLDLSFVEKVPGELAARYRDEDGKSQLASLITIPTAEEERSGRRPILKTDRVHLNPATPTESLVKPFLWKEGDLRPQETDLECYYMNANELPRSLQDIKGRRFMAHLSGREFNDALASWLPYVDRQTFLQILEMWRAGVRNDVPLDYVDGDYVPSEYRRDDWGDLPHQMVEQALDALVEAVRRTPNLDSEKRGFLRDLVTEVRTVRIRGTWGFGPYLDECGPGCSTYDQLSETVHLAFYEGADGWSQLRLSTNLYRPQPTQANKLIACLPTLGTIFHEGEHGVVHLSDIDAEHRVIYRKEVRLLDWLTEVFSAEFAQASPEVRDPVQGDIRWVGEMASQ